MHLTSKQIFTLLIPFLLSGVLFFFTEDIVSNVKYLLPAYEEYSNKTLDEKATLYLKIEAKNTLYKEIQSHIKERSINAKWIADKLLYKKTTQTEKVLHTQKNEQKVKKLTLEALFPKNKVAIINGIIVKESTLIGDIKILKIENERVLLQSTKGKKWIYLFQ